MEKLKSKRYVFFFALILFIALSLLGPSSIVKKGFAERQACQSCVYFSFNVSCEYIGYGTTWCQITCWIDWSTGEPFPVCTCDEMGLECG